MILRRYILTIVGSAILVLGQGCGAPAAKKSVNGASPASKASAGDDDDDADAKKKKKKKNKGTGETPAEDDAGGATSSPATPANDAPDTPTSPDAPAPGAGPAPAADQTTPVGESLATGCYRIGGGGFFANDAGHSCGVPPIPFFSATCGNVAFDSLPERKDHGANVLDGGCALSSQCYRIDGGGFWSNGQGHSCVFLGENMPKHCGGKTVAQFNELPALTSHWGNALDGPCDGSGAAPSPSPATPQNLAAGCYRVGGGGFWSNGAGQSCGVPPVPFLGDQCGTNDFNALTVRADHGANAVQGGCRLPNKCYRIGSGGYWSNGQGHSCVFSGPRMAAHCAFGVDRFNELPDIGAHWGNVLDGTCAGS